MDKRVSEGWLGTVFRFMFFDAPNRFIYGDLRAFYVFYPIFMDFRGDFASLKSGSNLPKGKAVSR